MTTRKYSHNAKESSKGRRQDHKNCDIESEINWQM